MRQCVVVSVLWVPACCHSDRGWPVIPGVQYSADEPAQRLDVVRFRVVGMVASIPTLDRTREMGILSQCLGPERCLSNFSSGLQAPFLTCTYPHRAYTIVHNPKNLFLMQNRLDFTMD